MACSMSADTTTSGSDSDTQPVLVCTLEELQSRRKMLGSVHGRSIMVVTHNGILYALDSKCYHSGGPLDKGEVKDIEDRPCVLCPWHYYIVCLDTGESLYPAIDPQNPDKEPEWKSKGLKQRTHHVETKDGNVYVTLSDCKQKLESDYYYTEEYEQRMQMLQKAFRDNSKV